MAMKVPGREKEELITNWIELELAGGREGVKKVLAKGPVFNHQTANINK